MRLLGRLLCPLLDKYVIKPVCKRKTLLSIPKQDGTIYLHRWNLIPKNRFFNVYLHLFLASDDDRALHDHPWPWFTFLIKGQYHEETVRKGGIHVKKLKKEGSWRIRSPWYAHRIEILGPVWTIFITGPKLRKWGFHCKDGWVHEDEFFKQGGCS